MKVSDFISLIKQSSCRSVLYHFTDNANLPSVRVHGLLSKAAQEAMGLRCPMPGGDSTSRFSDRTKGVFDDVSLSMTNNHQMAYVCRTTMRHIDQYYLHINPDVLLLPGVRVANAMANASTTQILPVSMGLDGLDLEVLYSRQVWSEEIRTRVRTC